MVFKHFTCLQFLLYILSISTIFVQQLRVLECRVSDLCMLLQEYIERVDPGSHLGLNEESIAGYWLSQTFRTIRKLLLKVVLCVTDVWSS